MFHVEHLFHSGLLRFVLFSSEAGDAAFVSCQE